VEQNIPIYNTSDLARTDLQINNRILLSVINPAYQLGMEAIALLIAGGLSYTVGALIMATKKPNPFPPHFGSHEIWHICVLAGNTFIFLVMLFYVLPYPRG
jgi:channel protein (hemolysin III family)